jgi:mono/diheme cytochrome c family protein|tara:strand:+ start:1370 stop:2683 length:1314 start_codon:yes stop_codon:yes gene_type:complete
MKAWQLVIGSSAVGIAAAAIILADVFPKEIEPLTQIDQTLFSNEKIEIGQNLALLGDCSSCHKKPGTQGLSGGIALPTPFGTIYSTNITPDVSTGIGSWNYEAFVRSMRHGVDREGNHLYPAFPYDHFAATDDTDLLALYQYLMTRDPITSDEIKNELKFPFSIRPILAGWKFLFHSPTPFKPNTGFTEEENRGAYLAETLGHCSACHSPRNIFGAVKQNEFFAGGEAEGWLIPPLAKESISVVGWDLDDYADYLFDGWSEKHGIAAGPMTEVVNNLFDANEDDVYAIAAWLTKITPEVDQNQRMEHLAAMEALDLAESFDFGFSGQNLSNDLLAGAQVFKSNCVKCHKERLSKTQPTSLGLTFSVNADSPVNLFNVVLKGIEPPIGSSARRMQAITLPPEDLAKLAAFVRWRFSSQQEWSSLDSAAQKAITSQIQH